MKKNKITYVALSAVAIALVGGGLYANQAAAHFGGPSEEEFINRFAERFNLEPEEVRNFFAEKKAEHKERIEERVRQRLNQAVENGDLTKEQLQLVLDKRAELKEEFETTRGTLKDLSLEERRELKEAKKAELQAWAEENNIDLKYLRPLKGHKRGHSKLRIKSGFRGQGQAVSLNQQA